MTLQADTQILQALGERLSKDRLTRALRVMHLARMTDEKMVKLVRQNKGGTFLLTARGHEMIGAVCSAALRPGTDWACAYYRDQPLAIGLGCDLVELFGVCMGRATEQQSAGRMMPYHFSEKNLRMPTQSSVVASQFLPAVGIAYGVKASGVDEVVYVSGGDGATSEGDFHEALNFAGIHKLPIIFVVHDNGWAISVPAHEQIAGGDVVPRIQGQPGVEVHGIDGCDYETFSLAMESSVNRAKAGEGPSVIVAKVPRLGPHSGSDDPKKYKTEEMTAQDQKRDPLPRFEKWLVEKNGFTAEEIESIKAEIHDQVEAAAHEAQKIPFPEGDTAADHVFKEWEQPKSCPLKPTGEKIVMVDAINQALREEMERDPNVIVFGEDVAHGKGGVFGVTRGLTEKFGEKRCFNTPLAEATVCGVALGLALDGTHTPVGEIQFAEYLWPGFDQLASEIASTHYRSGGEWEVPLVLRMPYGGYIQGGPYHSQSIEGILSHCPGLKIVVPSNAADAKGLLKTAIRDPNPVIFLEHKALYRQAKFCARPLPGPDSLIPLGKASVVRKGQDLTFVGYGMMVVMAAEVAAKLADEGISVEVIDLRSIVPLDTETVVNSVKKTGKLLVAHEAPRNCGFGAEIAAQITEQAFEHLDGPVMRVCGLDCAIPYSKPLENAVLPQMEDIENGIRELYRY